MCELFDGFYYTHLVFMCPAERKSEKKYMASSIITIQHNAQPDVARRQHTTGQNVTHTM